MHATAFVTCVMFITMFWELSEAKPRYAIRSTIPMRQNILDNCPPCETFEECNQIPKGCYWGLSRVLGCDRIVCAQGPNQRCGGEFPGCGDGLTCHSNRHVCTGCSSKYVECSSY